jgi:hypothetical protein
VVKVKVKLSLCLTKHQAMKVYGGGLIYQTIVRWLRVGSALQRFFLFTETDQILYDKEERIY